MTSKKNRVLVGSPIYQKPDILQKFLLSLKRLDVEGLELGIIFIDDNEDERSSKMLEDFGHDRNNVKILASNQSDVYVCNGITHYWNENLVWKVADFKNMMIEHAIKEDYDYLFLIDSDLLLYPLTIKQLISAKKDIISNIFWTKWQPDAQERPQVWLYDEYTQWEISRGQELADSEITTRYQSYIQQMRTPGVHKVGGLGACTLISQKALKAGVNFKMIENLSFWGEDRHFCIRAAALGFSLYVDTHLPAYHIYRDSDLDGAMEFLDRTDKRGASPSGASRPKLTLSMVIKNESDRYLRKVLEEIRDYIDEAVIIDDGSTDDSAEVCLEVLKGISVRIIRNDVSKFSNEIELRKQQWSETVKSNPEWILNLDADEMFEKRFKEVVRQLISDQEVDVYCFRLYDFWNETHYREDEHWCAHRYYRPFLVRYREGFECKWNDRPQHCGRFAENVFELPHKLSDIRLKHLGWVKEEDRMAKFKRYQELDPEGTYGSSEQYVSILDDAPNLVRFEE
ncbi:glycosyltransferase family 2 protein [Peribacillus simplex]|uniref:glycosyltransferase family 2 protein n=1 Tax=Peribacillus TaxID=2675229 RepID=UPI00315C68E3